VDQIGGVIRGQPKGRRDRLIWRGNRGIGDSLEYDDPGGLHARSGRDGLLFERSAMRLVAVVALVTAFLSGQQSRPSLPKPDETDPKNPVWDMRARKNENERYFQIGPAKEDRQPKDGWRLLLVIPGGDGSPDFMGFVRNIRANVLGEKWIVAELVAPKWKTPTNTWPSKLSPVPKMDLPIEEIAADVVADVGQQQKIDKSYVFALGWSSSGHVVYTLSLAEKPIITGAYVAMAVFHPKELPPLKAAKGRSWFLDHSPDDTTCPYKDAETARDALKAAGGNVDLVAYKGGHGWQDDPFGRLRKGIEFLEQHASGKK
jgi:hypothetical protein